MANGRLVLRDLDDVVAAVPHLVGAVPEDSIVILPVDNTAAPLARVDMPTTLEERQAMVDQLSPVYGRYASPVILLAYTPRRDLAQSACDRLVDELATSCPVAAALTVVCVKSSWPRGDGLSWPRVGSTSGGASPIAMARGTFGPRGRAGRRASLRPGPRRP